MRPKSPLCVSRARRGSQPQSRSASMTEISAIFLSPICRNAAFFDMIIMYRKKIVKCQADFPCNL